MGEPKLNIELLNSLIKNGYAVKDLGDGSWGWTEKGKEQLELIIRNIFSRLLYNEKPMSDMEKRTWKHFLNKAGFYEDGFPLADD